MESVDPRQWDDRAWEHRLLPLLLVAFGVAIGATLAGSPAATPRGRSIPILRHVSSTPARPATFQPARLTDEPMVQVQIADVVPADGEANSVVLLSDGGSEHVVPLFIAASDGDELQAALHPSDGGKPDAESLARQSVAALGGAVARVQIGVDDNKYIGEVVLKRGDSEVVVNARVSEALELAVASGLPVYVPTRLVSRQGIDRASVARKPGGFPSHLKAPERM